MDEMRREFQRDNLCGGGTGFDPSRLGRIIEEVADEVSADTRSSRNDLVSELQRRVVLYLNQCFAMVVSDGKTFYIQKTHDTGVSHATFLFKDEKSIIAVMKTDENSSFASPFSCLRR